MPENAISTQIIDACFKIHSTLGPGLLESVYENILCYELDKRNLHFERQKTIPLRYENMQFESALRLDLIVENKVIVEIKSVETVLPLHKKQLLTYLKISGYKLGLLVNFNSALIKDGITRIANNL
ncbi:GxxExxY protein [bacterium]|nr:GxxExxY protein [bacterium]NUN45476.1 GxxExxY protein [bacterium]